MPFLYANLVLPKLYKISNTIFSHGVPPRHPFFNILKKRPLFCSQGPCLLSWFTHKTLALLIAQLLRRNTLSVSASTYPCESLWEGGTFQIFTPLRSILEHIDPDFQACYYCPQLTPNTIKLWQLPLLKVHLVKACNEGNFVVNAQKKWAQCGHLFAHNSAKLEITSDNGFAEKLGMPLK